MLRRGDRVCRAAFLGPLECRGRVAHLLFERDAVVEACASVCSSVAWEVALLPCPLCLRFLEGGRGDVELPRQRVALR